jgi:hypothetical protein
MLSPMLLLLVEEQHRVGDSFYVFSQSDKDAQAIIHWIDTAMIS